MTALKAVYSHCRGSFSCIALANESVLFGFRDPYGLKPLVYGRRHDFKGSVSYMFSSESVALEALGFENIVDVKPGMSPIRIVRQSLEPQHTNGHNT